MYVTFCTSLMTTGGWDASSLRSQEINSETQFESVSRRSLCECAQQWTTWSLLWIGQR